MGIKGRHTESLVQTGQPHSLTLFNNISTKKRIVPNKKFKQEGHIRKVKMEIKLDEIKL